MLAEHIFAKISTRPITGKHQERKATPRYKHVGPGKRPMQMAEQREQLRAKNRKHLSSLHGYERRKGKNGNEHHIDPKGYDLHTEAVEDHSIYLVE